MRRRKPPAEGVAIEGDYPGWGVWRSDTGRWWAYRTQADPLTIGQMRAGCRLIVQAETPAELRTAISAEQAAAEAAARDRPQEAM